MMHSHRFDDDVTVVGFPDRRWLAYRVEGSEINTGWIGLDMRHPGGDVVFIHLEHATNELRRGALRRHHNQRPGSMQLLLNPPCHRHIRQIDKVVAVNMGHELGRQRIRRDTHFLQANHGPPTSIELQRKLAPTDQRARPGPARRRMRNPRARQRHHRGKQSGPALAAHSTKVEQSLHYVKLDPPRPGIGNHIREETASAGPQHRIDKPHARRGRGIAR